LIRRTAVCVVVFVLAGSSEANGAQPRQQASKSGDVSFDCVLGFLQTTQVRPSRVETLISLAEVYAIGGNREKAVRSLTRARQEAEAEARHPTPPATDARSTALAPFLRPDPDVRQAAFARGYLAIGVYDDAIEFARKIARPRVRAGQLATIASEVAANGDRQRGVRLLAEALAAINNPAEESEGLAAVSIGYARVRDCEQARRIALSMADRFAYVKANALASVASECGKAGSKETALQAVSDSLRVVDLMTKGRDAEKYEIFARAASVQIDVSEQESALRLLARALSEAPKPAFESKAGKAIADAYANARLYEKAKEVANSIEHRPSRADALLNIALRHRSAGDGASAAELLDESFRITLDNRSSHPRVRFPRFGEIAVEYARASRTDRAHDVLVAALREIRAQFLFEVTDALLDVLLAYGKAGLTPDTTATRLIEDLCSGKAFEPTPHEMAKERRAEAAADFFIKRWHQTLDLNVLFDELYSSDPKQRQQNVRSSYDVYRFWISAHSFFPFDEDVDEPLMRDFFFSFWNLLYMIDEYQLAYIEPGRPLAKLPAMARASLPDGKRVTRKQVLESTAAIRSVLPTFRKSLNPQIFRTARYLENLRRKEEKHPTSFRIVPGESRFGVPEQVEVYKLRRGVFEFYFIEEHGELKVLTLGFEL
jgi:tetratricopeptide (TPR) repeat protein